MLLLALFLLIAAPSRSQIVAKKSITLELAKRITSVAENEAKRNSWTMVIVVVDDGANLLYLERMDQTQIGSIDVAIGKAKTAVRFKRPSKAFEDMISNGRNAALGIPGVVPIEGGVPLFADGQLIGAIGVSGGTSQQDGIVAKAGAAIVDSLAH